MNKILIGFFALFAFTTFASDSSAIALSKGEFTQIAYGEEFLTVGCELETTTSNVINLKVGSSVSIALGEEIVSIYCE